MSESTDTVFWPVIDGRLTDRSNKVIGMATQHAKNMNCSEVRVSHILLGLLGEGYGVAAAALKNLSVKYDVLLEDVRNRHGNDLVSMNKDVHIKPTEFSADLVDRAASIASEQGCKYAGTEHLLLSLIEPHSDAIDFFNKQGVTPDDIRQEVLTLIGLAGPVTPQPPEKTVTKEELDALFKQGYQVVLMPPVYVSLDHDAKQIKVYCSKEMTN